LAGYLSKRISTERALNYSRIDGSKRGIREAIGGRVGVIFCVEEAKADVVGLFCLQWLADHRSDYSAADEDYISYVREISHHSFWHSETDGRRRG